jgi:hypothetical protein
MRAVEDVRIVITGVACGLRIGPRPINLEP